VSTVREPVLNLLIFNVANVLMQYRKLNINLTKLNYR